MIETTMWQIVQKATLVRSPAQRGQQIVPRGDSYSRYGLHFKFCKESVRGENLEIHLKKLIAGGLKGTPQCGWRGESRASVQHRRRGGEYG